jgi:hypothetical protein
MSPQEFGNFPLEGVGDLPNVSVAFPGEHWSDRYASGEITPGEAVVPTASAGKMFMRKAGAGDAALAVQVAIAMQPWQPPDQNSGPAAEGPNELVNTPIKNGEYVHAWYSGGFNLTLVVPGEYNPGDLIGWDANGKRPAGKEGEGAWAKNASADIDSLFEVHLWRPVNDDNEGILTVRSTRTQM